MKCRVCSTEVKGSGVIYCSMDCKNIMKEQRKSKRSKDISKSIIGKENQDFVVCQWCKLRVKRIYGVHIKQHHPDKTSIDYRKEFPEFHMSSEKDRQNTSKNSGLHMKEEKYREQARQNVLGQKNPNHSSKTSIDERQRRSPFSQKFRSYTSLENKELSFKEFVKTVFKDRLTET